MNGALGWCVVVLLSADVDPLKPARAAFGEGDSDGCLSALDKVLADKPSAALTARSQFLRAQCLNLKDGPSRATQALEAALDADPEMVVDASRVDPQLVGLFEGLKQRLKAEVVVTADKADTVVFVDGAEVGPAPATLKVVAGRHRLSARTRDGRFAKEKELVAHPRRSYELGLELAPVGTPPGPEGQPPAVAPTAAGERTWVQGLFADGRALWDPGRGVGFEGGVGWAAKHLAVSLQFVRGGYPGGAVQVGGRLPLLDEHLVLGVGVEGLALAVPGGADAAPGGVALGVGGNLSVALRSGIFEPFVEAGAVSVLSAPAAAVAVPRLSPVVGGGVRLFVP